VREKILAARRAGIQHVLLPRHNEKDLVEIPAEVKADLSVQLVDTLDDVVPRLFAHDTQAENQPRTIKKPAPRLRPAQRSQLEADAGKVRVVSSE
jgi:ATP-dependent Lon protease